MFGLKLEKITEVKMQNLLQNDPGSSLLSLAIILGWLGIIFVLLRILVLSIKKVLEAVFKKS